MNEFKTAFPVLSTISIHHIMTISNITKYIKHSIKTEHRTKYRYIFIFG